MVRSTQNKKNELYKLTYEKLQKMLYSFTFSHHYSNIYLYIYTYINEWTFTVNNSIVHHCKVLKTSILQ